MVCVDFASQRGGRMDGAQFPFPVARITLGICNGVNIFHENLIHL